MSDVFKMSMHKVLLAAIFTGSLIRVIFSHDACLEIGVSITQKVEKAGFHRDIKWHVEVDSPYVDDVLKVSGCKLALRLDVPSSMYVNPDELYNLKSMGMIDSFISTADGFVNIESMAHESKEHTTYIYLNGSAPHDVLLPIHLRYHLAQIGGGYVKVEVPKPSLLVRCNKSNLCHNYLKVKAPCNSNGRTDCFWRNVTYNGVFDTQTINIPIGDVDDYPLVVIVTLLLSCAGCFYVLSILYQKPP